MSWQQVSRTRRVLAREHGTVIKDWGGRLPIALIFPNTYYLGMSNLAVHTLYHHWNKRDDIVCERVFTDLMPPLSLESGAPLSYFPVLAFSIAYEMDYFSVVALLRAADIPPLAEERDESFPFLLAGGPALSANPEPLAPLLDAIVIGEVEPVLDPLSDALQQVAREREAGMEALSRLPGLYLPHQPPLAHGPRPVRRQWLPDLDSYPTRSAILTPDTEFAQMGLIEIARGCGRGCRFCLAGYIYRPPRQRTMEGILAQAAELLRHTDRLGLVSAAVSDHSAIDELAPALRQLGARLSVSSMRVDPVSEPLLRALAESGARTLTIAPEAGSERLRVRINKTQTRDDVLRAIEMAARFGFEHLKLYFMLGLPSEGEEDIEALIDLALECGARFRRQVTVNLTPFVPKAHTPFQRMAQARAKVVRRRLARIQHDLRRQGVAVKSESPAWAEVQGTLSRGDRRVARALLAVERPSPAAWRRALEEIERPLSYLLRQRAAGEPLPWDFVQTGVRVSYLESEAVRAEQGRTSPPCPPTGCVACGVCPPEA